MGRRLCLGDIHGMYSKLTDVLNRCNFSSSDTLYCVGDLCDRGKENLKTLQFLMNLKNFYPVIGNHDIWLAEYLSYKMPENTFQIWAYHNGGMNTFLEFLDIIDEEKLKIYNWLKNIPYMIELDNKIIIHTPTPKKVFKRLKTGYNLEEITLANIKESGLLQDEIYDDELWSRKVIACSKYVNDKQKHKNFFETQFNSKSPIVFSGHTPLIEPIYDENMNICLIDTGSFATKEKNEIDGHITVIDIDTFEYWQNDNTQKQNLLDTIRK